MIKFFRKIRQKLLSQNKFSKYLLYAIGEIILVMIGILLALQVNNWNEAKKNRTIEKTYLADIHIEFQENKVQFMDKLNTFTKQFELADSLCSKVFPITDENWNQVSKVYSLAFLPTSFDPNRTSINTLINSGKSNVVKNDSLRKLLLSWNDRYEDYKANENALQKWWDVYNDIYISESDYSEYKSEIITSISNELKIKLVKLMWKRRADLGFIMSKWSPNQESRELLNMIDTIISLTEPYVD